MTNYIFTSWGIMPDEKEEPANRPDLVNSGVGKIPRFMWQRIAAINKRRRDGQICALIIRRSNAGKLRVFMTIRQPMSDDVIVQTNNPFRRLIVTGVTDIKFYDDPIYNEYITMQRIDNEPVYSGRLHYYRVPGKK